MNQNKQVLRKAVLRMTPGMQGLAGVCETHLVPVFGPLLVQLIPLYLAGWSHQQPAAG
jgi:hypothetical protein